MAIDIRLDTDHCDHCGGQFEDEDIVRCIKCDRAICGACTCLRIQREDANQPLDGCAYAVGRYAGD